MNWLSFIPIITGVIVGIFACVYYYHNIKKIRTEMAAPEPEKKSFGSRLKPRLPLIIAGIAFLVSSFLLGYFWGTTNHSNQSSKIRVAILMPLDEDNKDAYQDGIRQLSGFIELIKDNPDYTKNVDFVIRDHHMDPIGAESIIREEIRNSDTKYFICTMSKICEPISTIFSRFVQGVDYTGDKPILISAVASSPAIVVERNSSYRYYLRSQEEGKVLADCVNDKFQNATYIAKDDSYGRGAVAEFQSNWKKSWTKGIFLSKEIKRLEQYEDQIKQAKIPANSVIFVAHYGNAIDNIVTALRNLGLKNPIYATSTLSVKEWRDPVKDILAIYSWHTIVPKYDSGKGNRDVIKDFMNYAAKRTFDSIIGLKNDRTKTFDDFWRAVKVPDNLQITFDNNGDIVIPVQCVGSEYFDDTKK